MHCESNGCRSGRKPCPTPRQCGAYSYADGGNYHPEYAENSYSHVHAPAALAESKPYTAPDDEPLTFCAKACWAGAAFVVAVIVAAGLIDWLMSF